MFRNKGNIKLHFIGIGGIGMSGIAEILLRLGYKISGSDLEEGGSTEFLRNLGAQINIGHRESHITDQMNVVIYSSAIDSNNPEIIRARQLHIPLIKRAEMLAELMRLKYGIDTHPLIQSQVLMGKQRPVQCWPQLCMSAV